MSAFLYRHYDNHGDLLYIGTTTDPAVRLNRHMRVSPWNAQVASVTLQAFPNLRKARGAEVQAIMDEKPRWNLTHKSRHEEPMKRLVAEIPAELHEAMKREAAKNGRTLREELIPIFEQLYLGEGALK